MKTKKRPFIGFTIFCVAAIGVCLIIDAIVNVRITWAFYPLISIPFVWLLCLPLLAQKHRVVAILSIFSLLLLPYLYLIYGIPPDIGWFTPVGIPSAVAIILSVWGLFVLYARTKVSMIYKVADKRADEKNLSAVFWAWVNN